MSYLVFARKWRPLTFDDVIGQEHITDTLKKAIEKNRVAHAFIFTGTRGVGKTTSARILARALNCEKGPTPNPCGVCTSCKDVLSGASFDVLEIDGASNNSVDDIRELRDNIGYSSMGGKYRIFVIDEVHMLSKPAFNALLKTLEEPPKNVIFIFATTEPQKIPQTIHSRCQRYDFRRIGAEKILERLIHICTAENINFERSALMLVARKAEGSMRDALSLLDQVYSFCRENLTEKEVRSVLGLVGMEVFERVMDAVAEKNAVPALNIIQEVLVQGFDLQEFIQGLQEHVRNLLFARIPGALESRGIELETDTIQKFEVSARRFSEGDLLRMSEIIKKAEYDLKWSAFPRFVAELMLLKLTYMDSTVSVEQLIKALGDPQQPSAVNIENLNNHSDSKKNQPEIETGALYSQSGSEPVSSVQNNFKEEEINEANSAGVVQENASAPIVPIEDLGDRWPDFLELLLREHPNLGSFLSLASIGSISSDLVKLKFCADYRFQYMEVSKKQNRKEIIRLLQQFTGHQLDLEIILDLNAAKQENTNYIKQIANIPSTIDDQIEKEPIIKTILEIFDGEIL